MVAVKLLEAQQSKDIINRCQWIMAIGVFMPLYVELALLVFTSIMLIKNSGVVLKSSIIIYMILVFGVSFITSSIIDYHQTKMIQQILALSLFLLLYEQIFMRNKNFLTDLFKKYITVCYYICVIALFQEFIYIIIQINIFSYLPGYFSTQLITPDVLRVTSTLSEGGWLGTSLLPTIIYTFYYNDPYKLLTIKKKLVISTVALLTMSPFVYGSLFIIALIKLRSRFRFAKRIMSIVIVCFVAYCIYTIIHVDKDADRGGVNNIFIRISDTYNVISNIDEDDLADILRYSGNSSSAVIATNMYIGLHAPSRLFGTGIGTNAQSYSNIVDVETSFEFNPDDGYSLFNRILSELGIVGLSLYILFVYKHFNKRNMINTCFFFMIMGLFMRGGNYMLYGTIFVHFMYYHTSKFNLSITNGKTNINSYSNV